MVKKQKLTLLEKLYVFEVARGMGVTLRHFLRNLLNPSGLPTINYPEEKRKLAKNFRGDCTACSKKRPAN
jgi:NADH-quinone oxidoreductase subunit I